MDMPPAAAIGHNSANHESARDIAAARLKFLEMVLQPGVSRRYEVVSRAFASDMSDAEFRVFYGYVHHGNRDACNIFVGQATVGNIISKSEQAVRRATKSLEGAGWMDAPRKQHRKAAIRHASIPPHAMHAIVAEVVNRQISAGQPIVIPASLVTQDVDRSKTTDRSNLTGLALSKTTGLNDETGQIRQLRPVKNDHITIEDKPYATPTCTRTREGIDQIRKRLLEAGGGAINEAYGGFLVLSDPIRWIDSGCDLEMDIVPAIQKAVAAKRGGKIVCWGYFTDAVQEARDRRLAPLAGASLPNGAHVHAPAAASYTAKFNDAWDAFPAKAGMSKPVAFAAWKSQACEGIAGSVLAGIKAYAKGLADERRRNPDVWAKHMHGWLNERRWEGYDVAADDGGARKTKAIALDMVRGNPEFILQYGWSGLDEVRRKAPHLWNSALDYARREFTSPDTAAMLNNYGHAILGSTNDSV
jgi:hypothetical protein